MADPIHIVDKYKIIRRKNDIPGHEWLKIGTHIGYQANGGHFYAAIPRTLKAAEREAAIRRSINKKSGKK